MKEKMISKIILVLTMMVMLTVVPMNVFATSDGATDLNDFWEDQSTELKPETPTTPEQTTPTTPTTPEQTTPTTPETQKPTQTPENTYSHAGIAEDTMMVVALIGLIVMAVFANKKVKEYNNI